jgi:hypothetical protein
MHVPKALMPSDTAGLTSQVVEWLTCQVISLSKSSGMDTGVAKPTRGGGCGSTSGEVRGLHVAQHIQGGGDQGGVVGTAAGSAEAM